MTVYLITYEFDDGTTFYKHNIAVFEMEEDANDMCDRLNKEFIKVKPRYKVEALKIY